MSDKIEDKILSSLHLGNGETLEPGDEDQLRDALDENEQIEDTDAELQRLADEGAIQGFGTTPAESEEGQDGSAAPRSRRSPGKRAAKKAAAKKSGTKADEK